MRPCFVVGMMVCFLAMGLVVVVVLCGPALLAQHGGADFAQLPETIAFGNAIVAENAQFGTTTWEIPQGKAATTQIQAYAGATSVLPGQQLTFYVSTAVEGTPYQIAIYRLGWYAGFGARLMASSEDLVGHAQGYYDNANQTLIGCSGCRIDTVMGLVEAHWRPSYTLAIPRDWVTGIYLAKCSDENGMQTYVPFVVRSHTHSLYLAVTPVTTYAAYNTWGGYSLYTGIKGLAKAVKVSFDRPYVQGEGASQVLVYEIDAIRWLERQGYDVSYTRDVDLHNHPAQLLQHKAYLSLGHDEYWTKEMRDGVERARDHGVGLAFLGANAGYWQMRFEPDRAGIPDRTIVCYKVASQRSLYENNLLNDLTRDPLYGKDNARLTAAWRDPVLARPENALIGIMFSNYTHQRSGFPWKSNAQGPPALLDGTGLVWGKQYGCDMVGPEWDRVFANGATPPGLQILSTSPTIVDTGKPDFSNTTYYIARSGAMVFASGSINWAVALDSYRCTQDSLCTAQRYGIADIQKLMANIMDALIILHPRAQVGIARAQAEITRATARVAPTIDKVARERTRVAPY